MDARTGKKMIDPVEEPHFLVESHAKRDRLLASLALLGGIGLIVDLSLTKGVL